MSSQPVEANVVLTADNTQYDQAMGQSTTATTSMMNAVDSLSSKIGQLTKSAGKKFLGFAAADVASITAATVAYGAFEKQMTGLNVQAALTTKTMAGQKTVMNDYAQDVNKLRRNFAMSTDEAARLEQTLTKMSDRSTSIENLGKTFGKLGEATGESAASLGSSMLQLQKTMGTPQRETSKFANQLVTLQARADTSAASILNFSQQIAPVGRAANISQTDLMGFSTAFIKAGQDGYQAANVFNKMMTDITQATATGSPELNKYANLVGLTTAQFKDLGGTDQFVKIFEAINRQGPNAIATLNRMGLDGARTVKTVTAMAQQGGISSEISAARTADPKNLGKAAETASDQLFVQMRKMRTEMTQTAEAIGENFAGPAKIFFGAVTMMVKGVRAFAESPFGKITAWAVAGAAAFAAVAASILLAAKALLTFSGMNMIWNSAMGQGLRGVNKGLPVDPKASPFNVKTYGWGAAARAGLTSDTPGGGPGVISRSVGHGLTGAGRMTSWTTRMLYGSGSAYVPGVEGSGGYDDPVARQSGGRGLPPGFRTMPGAPMTGPTGFGIGKLREGWRLGAQEMQQKVQSEFQARREAGQAGAVGKGGMMAAHADELKRAEAAAAGAKGLAELEKQSMSASKGLVGFGKSASQAMMMIGSTGVGAGKFAGGIAKSAYGLIGGNPLVAAGLVGFAGYEAYKHHASMQTGNLKDSSQWSQPYFAAGGLTAPPTSEYTYQHEQPLALTKKGALTIDASDIAYAKSGGYKLKNKSLEDLTQDEAEAQLIQQWPSLSRSPKSIDAVAHDLIAKYGVPAATSMLSRLQRSKKGAGKRSQGSLDLFAGEAATSGRQGFWGHALMQQSGTAAVGKWGQFYSGLENRENQLAQLRGVDYAAKDMAKQRRGGMAEYFEKVNKESDKDSMFGLKKTLTGSSRKQDLGRSFDESMLKSQFGIEPEDVQYRSLFHPGGAVPAAGQKGVTGQKSWLRALVKDGALKDTDRLEDVLGQYQLPKTLRGDAAVEAINNKMNNPPPTPKASQRGGVTSAEKIAGLSDQLFGGKSVLKTKGVAEALYSADPNVQYGAMEKIAKGIQRGGGTPSEQLGKIQQMLSASGGDPAMGFEMFSGARQMMQRQRAFAQPYMTRTAQFAEQTGDVKAAMNTPISAGFTKQDRQAAEDQYQTQVQQQYDYFKNLLYQQREYEVMRKRAQEDYNLQRTYQEEAFNRSRQRAEADFALMRERATANFNRQTFRANRDFNLQRKRGEEDHNHQVKLMVEQQSKSMMDIYTRVQTTRTHSAQWLLSNAADQQKRMEEQSGNLEKLRGMGMSKQAIQQMGFTDPAKAADLARFATEAAADPKLVKEFNKTVSKRLKAAKDLVTDESSSEWTEFNRSYKLARTRGQHDFTVSMRESRDDFVRGLREQADDFHRSLRRQQEDYQIGMDQQAVAYKKTMDRSAEDLERAAKTIDGNFEEILRKATHGLSGHAKKQAEAVLGEFTTLKGDTSKEGIALMERLAAIFGVDYTAPKGAGGGGHKTTAQDVAQNANKPHAPAPGSGGNFAAGGVLPGYTPGRDVHHYHSATAGPLSLSGGEGIMVPEWVKAMGGEKGVAMMNKAARQGKFAKGGVFWPVPGHRVSTYAGHDGADINRGSGSDDLGDPIRAFRAGTITYVGYGHGYGQAIFERTAAGNVVYGHTSRVHVRSGQNVKAGQLIGNVGSTGNSSAPHLHFGIPGGTYAQAIALLNGADVGGFGGMVGAAAAGGAPIDPMQLLQARYPKSERRAAGLSQVHPFNPGGISHVINTFARDKIHKMIKRYGMPMAAAGPGMALGNVLSGNYGGNAHGVWNALIASGFSKVQAAGIMGNMQSESGFDPFIVQGGGHSMNPAAAGGGGYGLVQWTPGRKLIPYLHGHAPSVSTEINALREQLAGKGSSPEGAAGAALRSARGISEATRAFELKYERHAGGPQGNRITQARAIYDRYAANGAIVNGAQQLTVGEAGPEAVIPLNERGAEFMHDVMSHAMGGRNVVAAGRGGVSVYNTRIDRSTNFHGPITVQANNPHELINKLKSRQRVMALSRPSLTGSAA